MNITRDNYESFFLLYTDNELAVKEREALELFLKENTDLQKELDILQQSVVVPDRVVFKAKNSLLKSEAITEDVQEKILLYIDEELDKTGKKEMQHLLASDKGVAAELKLFHQTKQVADNAIVFPDKNILYKKEEGRVVPFAWRKLAAAAVFTGFAIWGAAVYLKNANNKTLVNVAVTSKKNPPAAKKQLPAVQQKDIDNPSLKNDVVQNNLPLPVAKNTAVGPITTYRKKKENLDLKTGNVVVKTDVQHQKADNNLPKPYFETINKPESNQAIVANVPQQTQQDITNHKTQAGHVDGNVYSTSFTENDNETKEGQFTFTDDEHKKSKLSGFLRKAKRVLERNTKMKSSDDNVKVANLEFAIQ